LINALIGGVLGGAKHDEEAGQLRGRNPRPVGNQQPPLEIIAGHYFGLTFRDDPFAVNIWGKGNAEVVEDIDPVAPFDAMNKPYHAVDLNPKNIRLSGAAPVEPGHTKAAIGYTSPDYVPPYLHPRPFPDATEEAAAAKARDAIVIPIGERIIQAHEDRLRDPRFPFRTLHAYPLTAPADRIDPGPYPLAPIDRVPNKYDRFIAQSMRKTASNADLKSYLKLFNRVDQDKDTAISAEEFQAEVVNHQGKTDAQEQALWKQYHITPDPDMTKGEFIKLAATGFDLGQQFVPRKDIILTLKTPLASNMGYWGGGAGCPNSTYMTGARIKVRPNTPQSGDNTALNCIHFKCSDGTVLKTVEGPDGEWTDWAECQQGQTIHSVSVRVEAYSTGLDNTGMNDVIFKCRSPGHLEETTLMFGEHTPAQDQTGYVFVDGKYVPRSQTTVDDKQVVVGKGKIAAQGGWSDEMSCGTNGAICGGQGRLLNEPDRKDNAGLTEFRFFCCNLPLNCDGPCKFPSSADCQQCKSKQNSISSR
jgi:hypothetical protein